jgi:hypothetical protein
MKIMFLGDEKKKKSQRRRRLVAHTSPLRRQIATVDRKILVTSLEQGKGQAWSHPTPQPPPHLVRPAQALSPLLTSSLEHFPFLSFALHQSINLSTLFCLPLYLTFLSIFHNFFYYLSFRICPSLHHAYFYLFGLHSTSFFFSTGPWKSFLLKRFSTQPDFTNQKEKKINKLQRTGTNSTRKLNK